MTNLLGAFSQDGEEAARTWFFVFILGLLYKTIAGLFSLGALRCHLQEDSYKATTTSVDVFEEFCLHHGVIRIPDEGVLAFEKWSQEQKYAAMTNLYAHYGRFFDYICMAIIVPLCYYKLVTWILRQLEIDPIYHDARAVKNALGANQFSLCDINSRKLINRVKFNPQASQPWTQNCSFLMVLLWNIAFPFWTYGIIHLVTSHFQLPMMWLNPLAFQDSSEAWFPTRVVCLPMATDISNQGSDYAICNFTYHEAVGQNLRTVCWLLIIYNLIVLGRTTQLIYLYLTNIGRQRLILSWLPLQGDDKYCAETLRAFAKKFAAEDLLAFTMIERGLGKNTIMYITTFYFKDFSSTYQPVKETSSSNAVAETI